VLILVVEDDVLLAMDIEAALTDAGYRILGPVAWAAEVVELVKTQTPDLALIDLGLRDGQTGAALARYLLWRWSVHSIFITGDRQGVIGHQDAALGWLRKPFSHPELLKSIALAKAMLSGTIPTLNVPTGFQPFPCIDSDRTS
jgi:DNA-binding response OmpR family regulator